MLETLPEARMATVPVPLKLTQAFARYISTSDVLRIALTLSVDNSHPLYTTTQVLPLGTVTVMPLLTVIGPALMAFLFVVMV